MLIFLSFLFLFFALLYICTVHMQVTKALTRLRGPRRLVNHFFVPCGLY